MIKTRSGLVNLSIHVSHRGQHNWNPISIHVTKENTSVQFSSVMTHIYLNSHLLYYKMTDLMVYRFDSWFNVVDPAWPPNFGWYLPQVTLLQLIDDVYTINPHSSVLPAHKRTFLNIWSATLCFIVFCDSDTDTHTIYNCSVNFAQKFQCFFVCQWTIISGNGWITQVLNKMKG